MRDHPAVPGPPRYVVTSTTTVVEGWAAERLVLEPTAWMLDFRSELRAGIGRLVSRSDHSLACTYESAEDSISDVENVLVYNVGTSAFAELRASGVILERSFLRPLPPPTPLDGDASHYHRYELTEHRAPASWTPGRLVASFASAPVAVPLSAASAWFAVRRGDLRVRHRTDAGPLCLKATTTFPVLSRSSLYSAMKPLLDGVVAALHAHDGTELTETSRRIGATLAEEPADLRRVLQDDSTDALGRRAVVVPFRGGVVWRPADDRLVAIDLRADVGPELRITGELYEAAPL